MHKGVLIRDVMRMKLYTFEAGGRGVASAQRVRASWSILPCAHRAMMAARGEAGSAHYRFEHARFPARRRTGNGSRTRGLRVHGEKRPAVPVGERLAYAFEEVKLLAPIPRPGKILCSGINYRGHKEENPERHDAGGAVFLLEAAVVPSSVLARRSSTRANESTRL